MTMLKHMLKHPRSNGLHITKERHVIEYRIHFAGGKTTIVRAKERYASPLWVFRFKLGTRRLAKDKVNIISQVYQREPGLSWHLPGTTPERWGGGERRGRYGSYDYGETQHPPAIQGAETQ